MLALTTSQLVPTCSFSDTMIIPIVPFSPPHRVRPCPFHFYFHFFVPT
jgi:hypothetical protein